MKNIKELKRILIKTIKELDQTRKEDLNEQIAKCNSISNGCLTYIKTENLEIRIAEAKEKGLKING